MKQRLITSSLWQPSVSGVVDSSRSVMHVFTPSCNIFHTLFSTGFKSGEFQDHSWGGINSRVSLSNNAIAERAQWWLHVSQRYSVETLFRWIGKRLHHVAANLFRKLLPNFIRIARVLEEILQIFWSLFSGHSVVCWSSFFLLSNAAVGGHWTKLNQTLPHARKWATFENDCLKFGEFPVPRNVGPQNCPFPIGFTTTRWISSEDK